MLMPKMTTAKVPPDVASEYAKASRPQAASEAIGDGYTKTKEMQKARSKKSPQFGLPASPKKPSSGKTKT